MKRFLLLLILLFISLTQEQDTITARIYYNKESKVYTVIENKSYAGALAKAVYTKGYEKNGWDYLTITSLDDSPELVPDEIKSFAFGYIEGWITHERIYPFYLNMKAYHYSKTNGVMPKETREFLEENYRYIRTKALQEKDTDVYWEHIYNIYRQMEGIVAGYNARATSDKQIPFIDFQTMVALSDIDDIPNYKKNNRPNFSNMTTVDKESYIDFTTHCSSLVKVAADFSDIWFGHNTWTGYNKMIRIFKEYRYISSTKHEKSKVTALSGYPGILVSDDDFYVLDTDLVVSETTNSIFKEELYDLLTPKSVLCWMRALVANRMSTTGLEWAQIFSRENSGTYNNQFQILDLKKVDLDKHEISDGALVIVEQTPGLLDINDVTDILRFGYWPSYNSAYSKVIRERSGYNEALIKDPNLKNTIDYAQCARAKIFRRDQDTVKDIDTFKKMITYNNYLNDPFSLGNPTYTISSRRDLSTSDPQCIGAIDAKMASAKDIKGKKQKRIHIRSGPSNEYLPSFEWETSKCKDIPRHKHEGHIPKYEFPWVEYVTTLFDQ